VRILTQPYMYIYTYTIIHVYSYISTGDNYVCTHTIIYVLTLKERDAVMCVC